MTEGLWLTQALRHAGCQIDHRVLSLIQVAAKLPPFARSQTERFPGWKIGFIEQNRALYEAKREWIDRWRGEVTEFDASFQKLEWSFQSDTLDLWQTIIIQFRASGLNFVSLSHVWYLARQCLALVADNPPSGIRVARKLDRITQGIAVTLKGGLPDRGGGVQLHFKLS